MFFEVVFYTSGEYLKFFQGVEQTRTLLWKTSLPDVLVFGIDGFEITNSAQSLTWTIKDATWSSKLKFGTLPSITMTKWVASFVVQVRDWAEFVISNPSIPNTKTSGRDVSHKRVLVCPTPSPQKYKRLDQLLKRPLQKTFRHLSSNCTGRATACQLFPP